MQALDIDFARRRRTFSTLGVVLCVAGALAAGAVLLDYFDAREDSNRAELRQVRLQRTQRVEMLARRRESPASAARGDAPAVARVVAQLGLPWGALLREIELRSGPAIALIGMESQGQTRILRLTGEAKTMADVVSYISQLRASPLIGAANLSGHEERLAGAVPVIRFSLDVTWSGPS